MRWALSESSFVLGLLGLLTVNNVITLSPPLLSDVAEGHWEVAVEHSTTEIKSSLRFPTSDGLDAFLLKLALFSQNWRSFLFIYEVSLLIFTLRLPSP